jgi:hypothetical protein
MLSKSFHFRRRRFRQKAALDTLTHKLTKIKAARDGSSFQAECVQITRRSAAAGSARKTPLAPQEWARAQQVNCHCQFRHSPVGDTLCVVETLENYRLIGA